MLACVRTLPHFIRIVQICRRKCETETTFGRWFVTAIPIHGHWVVRASRACARPVIDHFCGNASFCSLDLGCIRLFCQTHPVVPHDPSEDSPQTAAAHNSDRRDAVLVYPGICTYEYCD